MITEISVDIAKNESFEIRRVILSITCRQSRRSDRYFIRYDLSKQTTDHGARLEIHQDGAGHVAATSGLVLIDVYIESEQRHANALLTALNTCLTT